MSHSINGHPVTVAHAAEGVVITGRLDPDIALGNTGGMDFAVTLRSQIDARHFLDCLATAGNEVHDDARGFGVLTIGDRPAVEPQMMCRHLLAWTRTEPPTDLEPAVCWIGWDHSSTANFVVTLDLEATAALYNAVSALVDNLPEYSRVDVGPLPVAWM